MSSRNEADKQLEKWKLQNEEKIGFATNSAGIPIVNAKTSLTIGKNGRIPLQDWQLIEHLSHFNRERIPERVVHAKGAGAFGYFECTKELSAYTVSKVFEAVDKRTSIAVRFSVVAGNLGSADTVRDPRGFALKFYTDEGIWDLVGNNTPIFFMRDPILFPMFIHSQKRNPVTNLRDWDAFWDYISLTPMSVHQVMFLFSDRGIPKSYRHQHGFGSHTFSLINKDRKLTWCKFIYKTDQGIENLDPEEAEKIAGRDPDYAVRDLYESISEVDGYIKKYPSWTFYVQLMTPEQAKLQKFNPFDITKVWPHKEFPLIEVGRFVLNRNASNNFAEIEQLAFSPNNLTPGVGASPDRLLQGRLFAYQDAHRYRLGANFQQIPVNKPINLTNNFQRDGFMCSFNQGGAPNYYPNSFGGPNSDPFAESWTPPPEYVAGFENYYPEFYEEDNYSQPRAFWEQVLDEGAKNRLVHNLAGAIKLANRTIQERIVDVFNNVSDDLGVRLKELVFNDAKIIQF
ncbi:catalase isoform X3 [Dendroctonus ponderosae]|uniref:catalase isoform X3 n=1 Tax=Dendroctonus ponderosae TaxID=77166 RepID=UPI002035744F|nr:catalase isoform X3 [Dendroctonus ponderosae]